MESFERLRLEARRESLCETGCRHVWHDIDALERGEDLNETRDLSVAERKTLSRLMQRVKSRLLELVEDDPVGAEIEFEPPASKREDGDDEQKREQISV